MLFCFVLLPLVFDRILGRSGSIVLCVSPLTSLMMEQRGKYGKLGISFTRQCHHTYVIYIIYLIYTPQPLQMSGWEVLITFQDPRKGIVTAIPQILPSPPSPPHAHAYMFAEGSRNQTTSPHAFYLHKGPCIQGHRKL